MVFFKLHESPRFLVHAGRPQEALESLQMISRFNGSDLTLMLDDVDDQRPERTSSPQQAADEQSKQIPPTATHDSSSSQVPVADYQATGEATVNLESHSLLSPVDPPTPSEPSPTIHSPRPTRPFHDTDKELGLPPSISPRRESRFTFNDPAQAEATDPVHDPPPARPRPRPRPAHRLSQASTRSRRRSSYYDNNKYCGKLPRWFRKPLLAWLDRVSMVLTPEWLRTTLLVWAAWCSMSLGQLLSGKHIRRSVNSFIAYTMFNVFLPKLLETSGTAGAATGEKTLEASLWDVVIFTIGGCPGAIVRIPVSDNVT